MYYPDSTWLGPARALSRAPVIGGTPLGRLAGRASGHHADDWESVQIRIGQDGTVMARASAHNGYAGRARWPNLNELPRQPPGRHRTAAWTPRTGWARVTRGSHAGRIPSGPADDERRTASNGIVLVPIETLSAADRATGFAIVAPWRKPVYTDPEESTA